MVIELGPYRKSVTSIGWFRLGEVMTALVISIKYSNWRTFTPMENNPTRKAFRIRARVLAYLYISQSSLGKLYTNIAAYLFPQVVIVYNTLTLYLRIFYPALWLSLGVDRTNGHGRAALPFRHLLHF